MPLAEFDFVSPPDVIGTATAFLGGHIQLDPASSDAANTVVCADRYFTPTHNGLRQLWNADSVYLYPPRDLLYNKEQPPDLALFRKTKRFKRSAQRVWLEEAVRKYKRQEFNEAIIFITSTDVALRVTQQIGLDLPMCILRDTPEIYIDTPELEKLKNTRCHGFIFYIPHYLNTELRLYEFQNMFSELGRVFV